MTKASAGPHTELSRLASIQAVRAIAAWAVVLGHALSVSIGVSGGHPAFADLYSRLGVLAHAGVDAFFVVSGAIMVLLYGNDTREPRLSSAGLFVAKRVLRLFPLFWITAIFTYAMGSRVLPEATEELVSQLMLMSVPLFHPVAWTLVYEIQFYLIVALALLVFGGRRRLGFFVLSLSVTTLVVLQPDGLLRHPLMIEFIFGVGVGALHRWRSITPKLCTIVGTVLLITGMAYLSGKDLSVVNTGRIWALAAPAAILIYGLLGLEKPAN